MPIEVRLAEIPEVHHPVAELLRHLRALLIERQRRHVVISRYVEGRLRLPLEYAGKDLPQHDIQPALRPGREHDLEPVPLLIRHGVDHLQVYAVPREVIEPVRPAVDLLVLRLHKRRRQENPVDVPAGHVEVRRPGLRRKIVLPEEIDLRLELPLKYPRQPHHDENVMGR